MNYVQLICEVLCKLINLHSRVLYPVGRGGTPTPLLLPPPPPEVLDKQTFVERALASS